MVVAEVAVLLSLFGDEDKDDAVDEEERTFCFFGEDREIAARNASLADNIWSSSSKLYDGTE